MQVFRTRGVAQGKTALQDAVRHASPNASASVLSKILKEVATLDADSGLYVLKGAEFVAEFVAPVASDGGGGGGMDKRGGGVGMEG